MSDDVLADRILLRVTVRFDGERRAEFEHAFSAFVTGVMGQFGWTNLASSISALDPVCSLDWAVSSVESLAALDALERSPDQPEWYRRMLPLVRGERVEMINGDQVSRLIDTL